VRLRFTQLRATFNELVEHRQVTGQTRTLDHRLEDQVAVFVKPLQFFSTKHLDLSSETDGETNPGYGEGVGVDGEVGQVRVHVGIEPR